MSNTRVAWHFLKADWTTGEGGLPVKVGVPLVHTGVLTPCYSGLHASVRAIDALQFATSSLITQVECGAPFVDNTDKFVCTTRTPVWGYCAEDELRTFARLCALDCLGNWKSAVPSVVRKWLETGDPNLRSAAWSAARSAADSAAEYAAEYAARSAADSAAEYAADSAARSAARFAADSAARLAAEYAARSAADSAAGYAAEYAAEYAARDKQNTVLESLLISGAVSRKLMSGV